MEEPTLSELQNNMEQLFMHSQKSSNPAVSLHE